MVTAPVKWHGGKHYLAERIIALMPPHVHYVEPYFGGGAVLLRKNPNGMSEVVNDLNGDLTKFWNVLQEDAKFASFRRRVEATPFSSVEFGVSGDALEQAQQGGGSDVDRAAVFFIRARQSRQGLMRDFATLSRNRTRRGMNEQVSSWLTAIEGLAEVHERLKRVVILNAEALEVIRQQDGPNTLFYCDPPYLHETRVTTSDYAYEMTSQQHADLLNVLSEIKGRFILSGYPSTMYEDFQSMAGWHRIDTQIDNKASGKSMKDIKTECFWMNYEPKASI